MSIHTRPVCPACSDTLLITYQDLSVDCPLHDGPLEPMPAEVAERIQTRVHRALVASGDIDCEPLDDPHAGWEKRVGPALMLGAMLFGFAALMAFGVWLLLTGTGVL